MTDEELAALLGDVAREEAAPVDPRWEAYTRGDLSPEEAAELEAEDAELAALYRPLGAETVDAVVHAHLASGKPEPLRPANSPWRWAAVVAALAAAVLIWIALPNAEGLPTYTVAVSGGQQEMRSEAPKTVPLLAPGAPVVVRLRPETRTDVAVQATVYAGAQLLEDVETAVLPTGAVELRVRSAPRDTTELRVQISGPNGVPQEFVLPIRVAD